MKSKNLFILIPSTLIYLLSFSQTKWTNIKSDLPYYFLVANVSTVKAHEMLLANQYSYLKNSDNYGFREYSIGYRSPAGEAEIYITKTELIGDLEINMRCDDVILQTLFKKKALLFKVSSRFSENGDLETNYKYKGQLATLVETTNQNNLKIGVLHIYPK